MESKQQSFKMGGIIEFKCAMYSSLTQIDLLKAKGAYYYVIGI